MKVIYSIQNFINVESKKYDGFRPRSLPGWDDSMCYPICFDSEMAKEEFENGIDEGEIPLEYVPIGLFYEKIPVVNSTTFGPSY